MTEHSSDKIAEIHRDLHAHLPSEPALRVKALESLLVEKGLVDPAAIDAWISAYTEDIGPKRGARLIARAWMDPAVMERLLDDAGFVASEMGFGGWAGGHLTAVANSSDVHNLVVCTLCSCYPLSVLGIPPNWYKTAAYRSRAVREPRAVLSEFGVELADEIAVRVWDSTSELRYIVVPQRPDGTTGWSEDQLAALVTRNAMIGTQRDLSPSPSGDA